MRAIAHIGVSVAGEGEELDDVVGHSIGAQPQANLHRAVADAQAGSGLPVVFGGRVVGDHLRISVLRGNRSDSLQDLSLGADVGLGGRALSLGRPVSVRDYVSARAISHEYDSAVAVEGLRALVAVPVVARNEVGAVLYGAVRSPVDIGDALVSSLVAAGRRLACEMEAEDDRKRWVGTLTRSESLDRAPATARRVELRQVVGDLRAAVGVIPDEDTGTRVLSLCDDLTAAMDRRREDRTGPSLSARERQVLLLASVGCSNVEIGKCLGVAPEAVKSYVRTLRRKFGVRSRLAVISAARSHGILP